LRRNEWERDELATCDRLGACDQIGEHRTRDRLTLPMRRYAGRPLRRRTQRYRGTTRRSPRTNIGRNFTLLAKGRQFQCSQSDRRIAMAPSRSNPFLRCASGILPRLAARVSKLALVKSSAISTTLRKNPSRRVRDGAGMPDGADGFMRRGRNVHCGACTSARRGRRISRSRRPRSDAMRKPARPKLNH